MPARRRARPARRNSSMRSRIPSPRKACDAATPGTSSALRATWCPKRRPRQTKAGARWSLLDAADRKASWRPGGMQHLSVHAASGRLYSLMHVGGECSHKDPGTEVWVYDLASRKRRVPVCARGSGHVHQHHAGCQSGAVRDLHRRPRSTSTTRRAASCCGRSARSGSRPPRWSPTEIAVYALDPALSTIIALGVALLFGAAALHKLKDWSRFRTALAATSAPRSLIPAAARRRGARESRPTLPFTASGRRRVPRRGAARLLRACHRHQPAAGRTSIDCGCLGAGQRTASAAGW